MSFFYTSKYLKYSVYADNRKLDIKFDVNNNWKRMEEILDRLIGHNNIFYGTNREVLLPC